MLKRKLLSKEIFPEYDSDNLDLSRDKFIIINRILEYGTLKQIRELFKVYKTSKIKDFVIKYGVRKLSLKSLNFWLNFFNVRNKDKYIKLKVKNKLWKY